MDGTILFGNSTGSLMADRGFGTFLKGPPLIKVIKAKWSSSVCTSIEACGFWITD